MIQGTDKKRNKDSLLVLKVRACKNAYFDFSGAPKRKWGTTCKKVYKDINTKNNLSHLSVLAPVHPSVETRGGEGMRVILKI